MEKIRKSKFYLYNVKAKELLNFIRNRAKEFDELLGIVEVNPHFKDCVVVNGKTAIRLNKGEFL